MILQSQEQTLLQQQFWIASPEELVDAQTWDARELLDKNRLLSLTQQLSEELGTDSQIAVAAHLSKNYAYMLAVPVLYTMSALNKGLDASIENIQIRLNQENGKTGWELILKNWHASLPKTDRKVWRERVVRNLLENLAFVWQSLHTWTRASKLMMWENVANYVYWLYEEKLQDLPSDQKQLAQEDFHYLLYQVPAKFFLETYQPFHRFYQPKEEVTDCESEQPVRMRKTCCLYYLLNSEGICCHTCPRQIKRNGSRR